MNYEAFDDYPSLQRLARRIAESKTYPDTILLEPRDYFDRVESDHA